MSTVAAPNCAETCVQGCILGDDCPHLVHLEKTREYILNTPWNELMDTAEAHAGALPSPEDLLKTLQQGRNP